MTQSAFAVCWFLSANRNCLWQIRRAMRFERPLKNSFHPRKKLPVSTAMSNASFPSTRRIENCDTVIRVYDEGDDIIETHGHAGDFKE
jgi:hypothetical protein